MARQLRGLVALEFAVALVGCGNSGIPPLIGTSSGSGAASSTGGNGAGTGTTTGGTTGSSVLPCTWVGDVCGVNSCIGAPRGTICAADGGLGRCYEKGCRTDVDLQNDPNNCGYFGEVCPAGIACQDGACGSSLLDCSADGGGCPAGVTCAYDPNSACVLISCEGAADDQSCLNQNAAGGFCCAGQCIALDPTDPDNCGGCGTRCAAGLVCAGGRCVVSAACTANDNGSTCALATGAPGVCCEQTCADLAVDPRYCGLCETACPTGDSCSKGQCSIGLCDAGCGSGRFCEFGFCYLVSCATDDEGLFCVLPDGGEFNRPDCCGGRCIDLLSNDAENCGGCGLACPAGVACYQGLCAVASICTADYESCVGSDGGVAWSGVCCSGICQGADSPECLGCGVPCPIGSACGGMPFRSCVDDAGNRVFCQKNADCPDGRFCAEGYCVLASCDAGSSVCAVPILDGGVDRGTCCGSLCADVSSDNDNCGGCGARCASGLNCMAFDNGSYDACMDPSVSTYCGEEFPCPAGFLCDVSACLPPTCGPGQENESCSYGPGVMGTCCGGRCVDENSDPINCGTCGSSCSGGSFSACAGELGCVGYPVQQNCLQSCGVGTVCAQEQCVDSVCPDLAGQPFAQYCLARDGSAGVCCPSGACAALNDDPLNCGACGTVCPPGATCRNGLCNGLADCAAGHAGSYCNLDAGVSFLCCPGLGCIDTSSDAQNCGACGVICPAGLSCSAGVCG